MSDEKIPFDELALVVARAMIGAAVEAVGEMLGKVPDTRESTLSALEGAAAAFKYLATKAGLEDQHMHDVLDGVHVGPRSGD